MKKTRTVRINKFFLIIQVFLFCAIIAKLSYVSLSKTVDGINIKEFANNRNTVTETILADRGTIYDFNGETLAKNVNSYTVIAYLDSSRTKDTSHPHHVIDKDATAKALSPLINMTEERILSLLNYDAYQVELGPGGRGITELLKEQIEDLNLPGISFIKSVKRDYPNGNFLSYTLGYAKTQEESGDIVGELGLELKYNEILTGKNGYKTYQQDLYGYQMANTPSITENAKSGSNIYLTIDTNIQLFTEQAVKTLEEANLEWATVSITDAKTGAILGVASSPSFNPNKRDLDSYYDPFVSYTYEPGSTMKIFSFLASIESGLYDGNETYTSGKVVVDNATISDWNKTGWGNITFDSGFHASSNVAATYLGQKLGKDKLKDFYTSLGFGKTTGIELPNELSGTVNFKYNTEVANASFGQGLTITPVQMIQALTAVSNNGVMLKPYIISKIVDSDGNLIEEGKKTELATVASEESIKKIRELMRGVVSGEDPIATGTDYEVPGVNLIGKTGTAQIASAYGGYLTGEVNYVRSFAGMFPYEDPQIIVYVAVSKITNSRLLKTAVRNLTEDVATYLNIIGSAKESNDSVVIDSYINKNTQDTETKLKEKRLKPITIGSGNKIISQYPKKDSVLNVNDKVFLLTNSGQYNFPDIKGYSRSDVTNLCNLLGVIPKFEGYGYVIDSSIKQGDIVETNKTIEIKLAPKYIEEKEKPEEKE